MKEEEAYPGRVLRGLPLHRQGFPRSSVFYWVLGPINRESSLYSAPSGFVSCRFFFFASVLLLSELNVTTCLKCRFSGPYNSEALKLTGTVSCSWWLWLSCVCQSLACILLWNSMDHWWYEGLWQKQLPMSPGPGQYRSPAALRLLCTPHSPSWAQLYLAEDTSGARALEIGLELLGRAGLPQHRFLLIKNEVTWSC